MAYKAFSTANLPDPAIDPAKGSTSDQYFDVGIWTGDGVNGRTIADLYGHTPDWVWIKNRSAAIDHNVADVLRGFKELYTNLTNAEGSQQMNAPTNDGLSGLPNANGYNNNGNAYVSWAWKAGGSGVSNTDGSITSTVSASTKAGFSIVSWTGNGTAGATIGHGLGAVPSFIIVKNRGTSGTENRAWTIYHSALGATKYIEFSNSAEDTGTNRWNDTAPTSSVFTVGDGSNGNENGDSHIAYCFADVEGFSKFGSYQGGSDPFVYLGFEPAMIMFKRTTGTATHWAIRDNARKTDNPNRNTLYPSKTDAEYTGTAHDIDFLSNGFKIRNDDGLFDASATYIYAAWAKTPFKYGTGV